MLPSPAAASPVVEARDLIFRYSDRARARAAQCESSDRRPAIAWSSKAHRAAENRRWFPSWPACASPAQAAFSSTAWIARFWAPPNGDRRLAAAPQFHENHVLAETFAFNLFLGRPTVLGPADFEEAQAICDELGLGPVLERMPAGMLQMVGETGWQLSHGERSRLYIARALLQNAELVILDESFAALDPENLKRAVECVVKRAPVAAGDRAPLIDR